MKTKNKKNKESSSVLDFINRIFFGLRKEDDGLEIILNPNRKPDPRELKGTKLADCQALVTCPTLS